MYGAILGDIMSFEHVLKDQKVSFLVDRKTKITVYTVTAVALADVLTSVNVDDLQELKEKISQSLIKWGKKCRNTEFVGSNFEKWLADEKHLPTEYNDNAAAARAAIIPYFCNDFELIDKIATVSTAATCNSSYTVTNAKLAAAAVLYAMRSDSKANMKINFEYMIGMELSETAEFKNIVAEAVIDFLNSSDVVSAIENSIARGGDINARAMISGSMAEGFYGMPFISKMMCNSALPENIFEVLDRADNFIRRNFLRTEGAIPSTEEGIENAIRQWTEDNSDANFNSLMDEIYYRMCEGGSLRVPLVVPDRNEMYDSGSLPEGTSYLTLQTQEGENFVAAFTGDSDDFAEKYPDVCLSSIERLFTEIADDPSKDGIVLNPDDENLRLILGKVILRTILNFKPPENKMFFYEGHISELPIKTIVSLDSRPFKNMSLKNDDEILYAHSMKKFPEYGNRYVIYTPLALCKTSNAIFTCCQACLDLAKKNHITAVAFPISFTVFGGSAAMNAAVSDWFNKNKNYGMTVAVASDNEEDIGNGKEGNFFQVNFFDNKVADEQKKVADETQSADKKIWDYSKGAAVSTSEEAKQKARDFKNQFADSEDFYKTLKDFGFVWRGEDSADERIKTMWSLNALARAIDEGFDPLEK